MSDQEHVPATDPAGARRMIDDGAVVLDVREDDEWAAGRIPGAVHLPLGRLGAEHGAVVPADRPVVAVCRVGGRSEKATVALRQAGYDVTNLAGGMRAWAEAGLPVEDAEGRPGRVI